MKRLFMALGLVLAVWAPSAHATVVLDPVQFGTVDASGVSIKGVFTGTIPSNDRGFAVFDLSGIAAPIQAVSWTITNPGSSAINTVIHALAASLAAQIDAADASFVDPAIHDAIDDGPAISFVFAGPGNTATVTFTPFAVSFVEAARASGELFGLGLPGDFAPGYSSFNEALANTALTVETVPLPASGLLLATGLAGFVMLRRRRRV